ncbi:membrane protein [Candidatus Magnetobacterium bavaricum]|uniref:Membrane protein n=1 Tax=Candidatus Magnetobacterium bavaricum TaxID=29290 RepID=A0A0F3GXA5_9BACT|nr:membrane protein [Candidatus Magnetobacterium bavaricum]
MGFLIYVLVVLQIPYRLYLIARNSRTGNKRIDKIFRGYMYFIAFSLILNWLAGFYIRGTTAL